MGGRRPEVLPTGPQLIAPPPSMPWIEKSEGEREEEDIGGEEGAKLGRGGRAEAGPSSGKGRTFGLLPQASGALGPALNRSCL